MRNDAAETGSVIAQYETLRKAALGDVLPPDARAGMMLFLRRGMWGWACALAAARATRQPAGPRPTDWNPPEQCRRAVFIFAAMAVGTTFQTREQQHE